jgi:CspA family cold shock protein
MTGTTGDSAPRSARRGLVALPLVLLLLAVAGSVAVGTAIGQNGRSYAVMACGPDVEQFLGTSLGQTPRDGSSISSLAIDCDGGSGVFTSPTDLPLVASPPAASRARVSGVVLRFDAEEGWGVIASPVTPGGAFVGFWDIQMDGYRSLTPGQPVTFVAGRPSGGQDGYVFVAEQVRPGPEPSSPSAGPARAGSDR